MLVTVGANKRVLYSWSFAKYAAKGRLAHAEERLDDAIDEFRAWDAGTDCQVCALAELGRAYEGAGEPDSAVAVFERYVETPWLWRAFWDATYLASTCERLGSLYEERGDTAKAIYYYGKQWKPCRLTDSP